MSSKAPIWWLKGLCPWYCFDLCCPSLSCFTVVLSLYHPSWCVFGLLSPLLGGFGNQLLLWRTHQFFPNKVVLQPSFEFLLNAVSTFHLPVFSPSPSSHDKKALHELDINRALWYCVYCTKSFWKCHSLFVRFAGCQMGCIVTDVAQVDCSDKLCYEHVGATCCLSLWVHSTRAQTSLTKFHRGILLQGVCKAVTWSSADMFIWHKNIRT